MIPSALVVLAVLVLIVLVISVVWRYRETKAERAGYMKIDATSSSADNSPHSSVFSFVEFIFTGGRQHSMSIIHSNSRALDTPLRTSSSVSYS